MLWKHVFFFNFSFRNNSIRYIFSSQNQDSESESSVYTSDTKSEKNNIYPKPLFLVFSGSLQQRRNKFKKMDDIQALSKTPVWTGSNYNDGGFDMESPQVSL